MIHTRSGADALAERDVVISPGTGNQHWGTVFFGPRSSSGYAPGPQATMSDLNANETIVPHFHGVTMFQLFIAGSGTIGSRGQVLEPLTVQFKDHHTAYGPVTAGPQGLSFVALRMRTGNSEPTYLQNPGCPRKAPVEQASQSDCGTGEVLGRAVDAVAERADLGIRIRGDRRRYGSALGTTWRRENGERARPEARGRLLRVCRAMAA